MNDNNNPYEDLNAHFIPLQNNHWSQHGLNYESTEPKHQMFNFESILIDEDTMNCLGPVVPEDDPQRTQLI